MSIKENELKLIAQKKGSNQCGQCAFAMISGVSLEESIGLFGVSGTSNFRMAMKAFEKIGIEVGGIQKIDNRKKWKLPETAYVRLEHVGRKFGHAVAFHKGKFYDSGSYKPSVYNSKEELIKEYNSRGQKWRFDSFFEVKM